MKKGSKKGSITIDADLCKGCELCLDACPFQSITISKVLNANSYLPAIFVPEGKCNGCKLCAIVCPEIAIEVFHE